MIYWRLSTSQDTHHISEDGISLAASVDILAHLYIQPDTKDVISFAAGVDIFGHLRIRLDTDAHTYQAPMSNAMVLIYFIQLEQIAYIKQQHIQP